MSISILVIFYGVIVVIVLSALKAGFDQMLALKEDAAAPDRHPVSRVITPQMMEVPAIARKSGIATVAISFFILCAYVYRVVF